MSKALFIDTSNLFYCVSKKFDKKRIDYSVLLTELGSFDTMIAYVSHINDSADSFVAYLEGIGFDTCTKEPRKRKVHGQYVHETDFKVQMTVDVMDHNCDEVIICSNDVGLIPLFDFLHSDDVSLTIVGAGIPNLLLDYTTLEVPESWLL